MKCVIPEISWHNRDPVLSVDIQPKRKSDDVFRLASGGTDSHVLIWYITHTNADTINLELAADLTRHQRPVNVVRWSPNGEFLASGDDESTIIVWKLKKDSEPLNILDSTEEEYKEIWLTHKILRGHLEDVYDLCWSPNSLLLISGSVDNTAIIWDVQKGKSVDILRDHNSFVQGVAWDPRNKFLATLSSDRYFRVFDATTKRIVCRCNKSALPVPDESPMHGKIVRLFHDDTLQSFFRRLSFSPDGELIVTPAGVVESADDAKPLHATYIYTRYDLKRPALVLPSPDQYTVAVRFCPMLYRLRPHDDDTPPVFELPYRMVFAIATKCSVYLYDTQQPMPIGVISNIHYTRLTDLAWSLDGRILIVSSTDGFCTLITFGADELGVKYEPDDGKENVADNQPSACAVSAAAAEPFVKLTPIAEPSVEQTVSGKAQPIAIRRKPRSADDVAAIAASQVIVVKTPEKVIALEIPTGIISTQDKFDSPEIQTGKPATPISFRRAPRNADAPATPATNTPAASETDSTKGSIKKSGRKPSVIAVRRHPRKLIDAPPMDKSVNMSATEDEALDAWPIDQPIPELGKAPVVETPAIEPSVVQECIIVDETEDIRLVYEDESQTNGTTDAKTQIIVAPTDSARKAAVSATKQPRRVELRTISTPKAKKKLI